MRNAASLPVEEVNLSSVTFTHHELHDTPQLLYMEVSGANLLTVK